MKSEWSLIFFTLFMQIAIGTFIVLAGLNIFSISKTESLLPRELTLKILYIILVIVILAMVSSFLHLGKPRNAFYVFTNIGASWLSREILFVVLFIGMASIFTVLEYFMPGTIQLKNILGILGTLFGLLTVFTMAKLYFLETVPAWNSFNTFVQFYSTTIILGIISLCFFSLIFNSNLLYQLNTLGIYKIFLVIILMFIGISLISFLYKLWALSGGGSTELESLAQIIDQNSILFYFRIMLLATSILIIIYQLFLAENTYSSNSFILLTVLSILSELIGRYLFYASYTRIGI